MNSADQYKVFEISRARISTPTPNILTDVSCDFSQSVQANAGIEVDGLGKLLIERTNKMQPCSRIYYTNIS